MPENNQQEQTAYDYLKNIFSLDNWGLLMDSIAQGPITQVIQSESQINEKYNSRVNQLVNIKEAETGVAVTQGQYDLIVQRAKAEISAPYVSKYFTKLSYGQLSDVPYNSVGSSVVSKAVSKSFEKGFLDAIDDYYSGNTSDFTEEQDLDSSYLPPERVFDPFYDTDEARIESDFYLRLQNIIKEPSVLSTTEITIFSLDNVAQGLGISVDDLLDYAENVQFSSREIVLDSGYSVYLFDDGETLRLTNVDNDANYSLKFQYDSSHDTEQNEGMYINYWGDLLVDISDSNKTAKQSLEQSPVKTLTGKKAIVKNGANEEIWDGHNNIDSKDAVTKLNGTINNNDYAKVTDGSGSFTKATATTTVGNKTYSVSDVVDSVVHAGSEVATFINNQVGNYLANTFDAYSVNAAITNFFSEYGQDLANGDLEPEDAIKYFTLELAEVGLSTTVANQLLSDEMKTFRDVLADPNSTQAQINTALANVEENDSLLNILGGMGFEDNIYLADKIRLTFAQMAVEFGLHSSGWDGEDYAKSAAGIITGVIVNEYVTRNWGSVLGNAGTQGSIAAITTVGRAIINDGFNQDWGSLGVSTALAFGTAYATTSIAIALGASAAPTGFGIAATLGASLTGAWAGGSAAFLVGEAALAGIGLVIALAASSAISSVYKGKVFYAGEYGDPSLVLNSIYQVQTITVNGQQVQALVAVNAQGSTVIASGITHVIGGSGSDTLVGNATLSDTISGNDGADYLEGRGGDDNLLGGAGNDHLNAGDGADILQGDAGDDIIFGEGGDDIVIAGDDDDFIHMGGGVDIASGGNGKDDILGGAGDDSLAGDAGDDTLDGGEGNDSISGGTGNDIILANIGNDTVNGDDGFDAIFGDAGNDTIYGGNDADFLAGDAGADIINGDNGAYLRTSYLDTSCNYFIDVHKFGAVTPSQLVPSLRVAGNDNYAENILLTHDLQKSLIG